MATFCNICGMGLGKMSRCQIADGIVCKSCLGKAKIPVDATLVSTLTTAQVRQFIQDPDSFQKYKDEYEKNFAIINRQREEERQRALKETAKRKEKEAEANRSRQQKQQLDQFGLDVESYTEENIREYNAQSAANIAQYLSLSKIWSFGSSFLDDSAQNFSINMAKVQVEQNWILMRQNEQIIRLLKQLVERDPSTAVGEEKDDEM